MSTLLVTSNQFYLASFNYESSNYDWSISGQCLGMADCSMISGLMQYNPKNGMIYTWIGTPSDMQIFMTINAADGAVVGQKLKSSFGISNLHTMEQYGNKLVMVSSQSSTTYLFLYDTDLKEFIITQRVFNQPGVFSADINFKENRLNLYGGENGVWSISKANLDFPGTHSSLSPSGLYFLEATDSELPVTSNAQLPEIEIDFYVFRPRYTMYNSSPNPNEPVLLSETTTVYQWNGNKKLDNVDMNEFGWMILPVTCTDGTYPLMNRTISARQGETLPTWMNFIPSIANISYNTPQLDNPTRYFFNVFTIVAGDPQTYSNQFILQVGRETECPDGKYLNLEEEWCDSCGPR